MTKPRDPLSFSLAISDIVGNIGIAAAARAARRAVRTVRQWTESDKPSLPRLDRAIALDRAYLAAGGGYPPILTSYARQLEIDLAPLPACEQALAESIASVASETAEAVSASIRVTMAAATPAMRRKAISEAEQGMSAMSRMIGRLKYFRTGNRAGAH